LSIVSKHIIADIVSEDPKVLDDQAAILEDVVLLRRESRERDDSSYRLSQI